MGSWIVELLCIATIVTTTIHRKETIREREREIAALRRELVEVKRDLLHQKSVGNVMDQLMKTEDWRKGNPDSEDWMQEFRRLVEISVANQMQVLEEP